MTTSERLKFAMGQVVVLGAGLLLSSINKVLEREDEDASSLKEGFLLDQRTVLLKLMISSYEQLMALSGEFWSSANDQESEAHDSQSNELGSALQSLREALVEYEADQLGRRCTKVKGATKESIAIAELIVRSLRQPSIAKCWNAAHAKSVIELRIQKGAFGGVSAETQDFVSAWFETQEFRELSILHYLVSIREHLG